MSGPVGKTIVNKVMALTPAEFAAGLAHVGSVEALGEGRYAARIEGGSATLCIEPLPPVRLGGLLALPRANVTITFTDALMEARASFLRRFDLAFQRGGG